MTIISMCCPVDTVVCENPLLLGEELGGADTIRKDKVRRDADKDGLHHKKNQVSLRLEIWSNNNQLTKSPSITKIQRHELNPPRVPISAIPRARRPPKAPESEAAV